MAILRAVLRVAFYFFKHDVPGVSSDWSAAFFTREDSSSLAIALADKDSCPGVATVELGSPARSVFSGKGDIKLSRFIAIDAFHGVGADEIIHCLRIRIPISLNFDTQPDFAQAGEANPV